MIFISASKGRDTKLLITTATFPPSALHSFSNLNHYCCCCCHCDSYFCFKRLRHKLLITTATFPPSALHSFSNLNDYCCCCLCFCCCCCCCCCDSYLCFKRLRLKIVNNNCNLPSLCFTQLFQPNPLLLLLL